MTNKEYKRENWPDRIRIEVTDLLEKKEKLYNTILADDFKDLHSDHRDLLSAQYFIMNRYIDNLNEQLKFEKRKKRK